VSEFADFTDAKARYEVWSQEPDEIQLFKAKARQETVRTRSRLHNKMPQSTSSQNFQASRQTPLYECEWSYRGYREVDELKTRIICTVITSKAT